MILNSLPTEFQQAKPIIDTIEAAGYEAYFVGGSVRDTILGKPIHDVDIATSAFPAEVKGLFKRTVDTGIEHGTVMILDHGQGYETTTFRTESGYQDFRRPDQVTFVRSLKEDLKRRDFTINALAMRANGEVIDLFDGLQDMDAGVLRAVGVAEDRFHEDALRMMRAVRFASQLGFTIESETAQAITDNAALLTKIAVERTRVEWEKLLMGHDPVRGLQSLVATELYRYMPHMADQKAMLQTIMALPAWQLPTINSTWTFLVWAMDLQDSTDIRSLLKDWKTSNELIDHVTAAWKALSALKQRGQLTASELFDTGLPALTTANTVANLFGFGQAQADMDAAYAALPIQDKHALAVNGGDLIKQQIVTPGPQMGQILQQLLTAVVTGQVKNEVPALTELARMIADTKND
ncbi:tRNA CCA-pyrophosphorylase [Lactobacillus plantarum JDM1] [Lactiplantibacillus mudanjiangensis]|uniref:CCA tRNA nucleotidyltransferase n=1 Tax=Lactiplantibacillus mudanjiangensis TaxID=1296538 RepID=UPI0010147FFD|nr:CCA tRNA nucleotidyltransferase [Lactiplantibacillus mudanjiangensis]VDG20498.1 tRNA CCA-pyrophosphorylase [Lactobacillus plantarum JDM1] [Lactiplantibacillus mudanjiangensis]VDG30764.1 tRNA CCA-pyrophosphorylase [Lactobacillus plantarum JDM1] [Lactiplantibacillus mudanjiangensis]